MTLSPELVSSPHTSETRTGAVLVTGGSRGIGRAICRTFAEDGATVVFFYLENHHAAAETRAALRELDVSVYGRCVDVSDADAVAAAFTQLEADGIEVSVLVNCAGITLDRTVPKLTQDLWQRVLDTNLTGCFTCTQAALAGMRERGYGRIVNISSIIGQ